MIKYPGDAAFEPSSAEQIECAADEAAKQRLELALATLRPWCKDCGWRKGGLDSWNGHACKCGHGEPPLRRVD